MTVYYTLTLNDRTRRPFTTEYATLAGAQKTVRRLKTSQAEPWHVEYTITHKTGPGIPSTLVEEGTF